MILPSRSVIAMLMRNLITDRPYKTDVVVIAHVERRNHLDNMNETVIIHLFDADYVYVLDISVQYS